MLKRALFIVDAKRGQGHLVRSRALMSELTIRGWRCSMLGGPCLSAASHDVVVVDGYAFDELPARYASEAPVFRIDDRPYCPGAEHAAVLVNASLGASSATVQVKGKQNAFGPDFSLLRPEFALAKKWNAADVQGGWLDLRGIEDVPVDLLIEKMLHASRVIVKPSMKLHEALCLKVPVVVLPSIADFFPEENEKLNWISCDIDSGPMPEVDGLGVQRVADLIEHTR